ncbi:MAG: hypothetical protein K8U03_08260 [Planctomycetia bacterium]|nr:hypothetical protein [Planctomycetia bacterium]
MSTTRYEFAVTIHARPVVALAGDSFSLRGLELPTLQLAPADFAGFARTFEEVAAALERLERMFFEPDGSFVWVSSDPQDAWQLDGVLYDRDGRMLHVDLKGTCPPTALDRLLQTFGAPPTQVVFQLTREALFLDEDPFRRYAAAGS